MPSSQEIELCWIFQKTYSSYNPSPPPGCYLQRETEATSGPEGRVPFPLPPTCVSLYPWGLASGEEWGNIWLALGNLPLLPLGFLLW